MQFILCSPNKLDLAIETSEFDFNLELKRLSKIKNTENDKILDFAITNKVNLFEFFITMSKSNMKDIIYFYNIPKEIFDAFIDFIDFKDLYHYVNNKEELGKIL